MRGAVCASHHLRWVVGRTVGWRRHAGILLSVGTSFDRYLTIIWPVKGHAGILPSVGLFRYHVMLDCIVSTTLCYAVLYHVTVYRIV